jgi:predicted PurR-regulated permease PerM
VTSNSDDAPPWKENWPPYSYWARVAAAFLLVAAMAGLMWALRGIILILLASLVLAIGLQPAIRWFERRGFQRGWGLAAILVGGLIVFGGMAVVLVPFIAGQLGDLVERLPEFVERARDAPGILGSMVDYLGIDALVSGGDASGGGEGAVDPIQVASDLAGTLFSLLTVLVVTPYFALEYPSLKVWAVRLLRPRHREDFLSVMAESTDLIANYIVGNLVISVIAGVFTFAGLWLLDIRFALALAAWVALTDVIPAVGATIGAAGVAAVVAFQGTDKLIAAMILLFVYQMLENYVIAPRVMNRAVDLSPATVIVALLIGGSLAGLVGALLALPVAAMIKVVAFQLFVPERLDSVRREVAELERSGKKRSRGQKNLP